MLPTFSTCRPLATYLLYVLLLFFAGTVTSLTDPESKAPHQTPQIITGFYGTVPKIAIHDGQGKVSWTWDVNTGLGLLPASLQRCVQGGQSATEVKFAHQGEKIVAIMGGAAVLINHAPGKHDDKAVQFAVCLEGELGNAHTLELLPGNLLAVATTGQGPDAGVWVYDASKMAASPAPVQKLPGVRAIHGMVWEQQSQTLWAAGNTDAADGSGGTSYGVIQGYKLNEFPRLGKSTTYTMSVAKQLGSEWDGSFAKWWNGPHDLVRVPSERLLLFPMDRGMHAINLSTGEFNHSGEQLVKDHLKGFQALGNRMGYDGEVLSRSDIKSVSLLPEGGALYVQAPWRSLSVIARQVNLLSPTGVYSTLFNGEALYRSRWFAEIPGWPTAAETGRK
ncbi:hypothetical protein HRG_000838 [Hirsutella rhossiliensis]|uniref:Uncharacterized protein n=1 Tax=Hirsutella rhossiliensis TaxID=111463 RepID=A0A9P8SPG8_9HYPO|nr:uncharacterized protein HRG_00838 [Hirsutella rhossiliensis]KAH0968196.1 hypothetical protein HRG_00838 [Hirsutella rhossiliensis]